MITVLRNTTFSPLLVKPGKHQLFVSGGIFQIAIFIRPWESELGRKKGEASVASLSLPVTFPSQPSITEVGLKQQIERLPPLCLFLSLRRLLARSLKSPLQLSVSRTMFNKQDEMCV